MFKISSHSLQHWHSCLGYLVVNSNWKIICQIEQKRILLKRKHNKTIRHILVSNAHGSHRTAGSMVKHQGSLFGLLEGVRQKLDASSSVVSGSTSAVVTSWECGFWSTHLWQIRPLRVMLTWPRYLGFVGREIHAGSPPVKISKRRIGDKPLSQPKMAQSIHA